MYDNQLWCAMYQDDGVWYVGGMVEPDVVDGGGSAEVVAHFDRHGMTESDIRWVLIQRTGKH